MRILFVNLHPYLPQMVGGVETSTLQLGRRLEALGHQAAVMSGLRAGGYVAVRNCLMRRLTGTRFPADRLGGLQVYRGHRHTAGLDEVIARFLPDVLIVSGGTDGTLELAVHCVTTGLPTFHYFHDLASVRRLQTPLNLQGMRFLANSHYTADQVRELLGVTAAVIPPLVEPDWYRTESSRRHVTMVNPRKIKGGEIAFRLAQDCPDIPFVFVEAWTDGDEFVREMHAATAALPNVRWIKPTSNMRAIYATTRVLLVPSKWEETWGRVVTEAHVSGIPVLASSVAALPESVGTGGILIDKEASSDAWRLALRRLWDDQDTYAKLSDSARQYSMRPEISPAVIAEHLLRCLAMPQGQADASSELPHQAAQRIKRG